MGNSNACNKDLFTPTRVSHIDFFFQFIKLYYTRKISYYSKSVKGSKFETKCIIILWFLFHEAFMDIFENLWQLLKHNECRFSMDEDVNTLATIDEVLS